MAQNHFETPCLILRKHQLDYDCNSLLIITRFDISLSVTVCAQCVYMNQ